MKFQQFLIDFQQIPAIPAKFRENFNEKYDILTAFEQKFAKSGKIINFCKILQKSKKIEFEAVQRIENLVDHKKR